MTETTKPPRPILLAVVTICLAAVVAYGNTLRGEFVFDDYELIVVSERIHKLWRPEEALRASYWGGVQKSTLYRPLPTWSLGIVYKLWGLDPAGYRVVNLTLHSLACVAIFFFLSALLGNYKTAWLAALVFAVHPIHTEAVSNVCFGHTELYAALFLFVALSLYLARLRMEAGKDQESPGGFLAGRQVYAPGLLWAEIGNIFSTRTALGILALVAAMLAMLSKESAMMLPVLAALSGFFMLQRLDEKRGIVRNGRIAARTALPLTAPIFVYLAMRLVATGMLGETMRPLGFLRLSQRLAVSAKVFVDYIGLLFFPVNQSALPSYDSIPKLAVHLIDPGKLMVFPLILLLVVGIIAVRRARVLSFAVLWFFIALLPASNIIPIGTVKAERLLYVPSVAAVILIAAVCCHLESRSGELRRHVVYTVFGLICAVFLAMTVRRNEVWVDGFSFYHDLIVKEPRSFVGHVGTGNLYGFVHEDQKAIRHLSLAAFIAPHMDGPYFNRALSYAVVGKKEEAVQDLRKALSIDPERVDARRGLAFVLIEMKLYDEAIEECTRLLNMTGAPKGEAYRMRGAAHVQKQDYRWAHADFLRALELEPGSDAAHYALAETSALQGDVEGTRRYADLLREKNRELPPAAAELLKEKSEEK